MTIGRALCVLWIQLVLLKTPYNKVVSATSYRPWRRAALIVPRPRWKPNDLPEPTAGISAKGEIECEIPKVRLPQGGGKLGVNEYFNTRGRENARTSSMGGCYDRKRHYKYRTTCVTV